MRAGAALPLALVLAGCVGRGASETPQGPALPALRAQPLALSAADLARLGPLEFRGGLQLSGEGVFGGCSGAVVSADGATLLTVNDEGAWLEARLGYDGAGRLVGATLARVGNLRGLEGQPLAGKDDGDAEALAPLPGGGLLVGFERNHRLWRYVDAARGLDQAAQLVATPAELRSAPANGGLEALAAFADGRVLALTEDLADGAARVGWLGQGGSWERLLYEPAPDFSPSDAAALANGDALVLERAYSPEQGARARVVRVPAAALRGGARLRGELLGEVRPPLADNFEGVAVRQDASGRTLVYLLSDDNFDRRGQRTLLLLLAWRAP
jgi:YD repeat-containing protein